MAYVTPTKLFAVVSLALSGSVWGGNSRCDITVSLPTPDNNSCLDSSVVLSWLPANGTLCGANFGINSGLTLGNLGLPGLHFTEVNLDLQIPGRSGSDYWLEGEDTGLSSWSGCGNHPGLVNGSFYCANTITAPVDLNEYLGSWEVLQGLMPVTCLAYNWELQAISLSFDPELSTEFLLPLFPVVFKLSGFTFAPNSQVALLDYMGADLQLRTGESLTTQVAVGGVVELAIGIPIILEIVLPLEGVFGMNLDSSAQGELASGHQVLESMVKADTSVASNWAVVIQTSFRPELVLLGFTFNFPISTKSQVLVRAGSSIIPDMYLSSMLYHATSLSELMGGLPDLGPVCDMDFLPKEVRESPFCHGDENMDTMEDDAEVALYFALEDGVAVIDLRAWGMWLAVKADSNAQSPLTLCKDGQCSQPFCVWDSQCPEGYHCCKTTFEFTCQKQYRHRVLGNVLTCAELPAMQAVDLAVDPGKGKNEGESCTWDSECALKLHCCWEIGDPYCRKIQALGGGLPCSCTLAAVGACYDEEASAAPYDLALMPFLIAMMLIRQVCH